jgi:hypothetical protein
VIRRVTQGNHVITLDSRALPSGGATLRFIFPPFTPDSRANLLAEYDLATSPGNNTATLYLRGPEEVAKQFLMLGSCAKGDVPEMLYSTWSHALLLPLSLTEGYRSLADLLKVNLSLTTRADLDCAVAFDWYKIPPQDDSPKWPNTPSGELIYRGKYWGAGSDRTAARRALISRYVDLIESHPLYRNCTSIVTVPGHAANGNSFAEQLAARVAEMSGKYLIKTESPGGPRPQAKESTSEIAVGHFALPTQVEGDVIILDDVYRSGTTMNAVARAAKMAGASRSFGLTAVRTMRN